YRVHAADELDALPAPHEAGANVLADMVGAAAIAEFDVLQIIVHAVLMHVVEVRHAAVGALERDLADLEAIALDHQLGVLVRLPIDVVAEIEAPQIEIEQRLVRRVLPAGQILRGEAFAPDEEVPFIAARKMLEPVAVAHLRKIIHRELAAKIEIAMLAPDDERDLVLCRDTHRHGGDADMSVPIHVAHDGEGEAGQRLLHLPPKPGKGAYVPEPFL